MPLPHRRQPPPPKPHPHRHSPGRNTDPATPVREQRENEGAPVLSDDEAEVEDGVVWVAEGGEEGEFEGVLRGSEGGEVSHFF